MFGLACSLALVPGANAQAGTATDVIVGRVTDAESGAPLVSAIVTATSVVTQQVRNVRTGTDGRYLLVFAEGGGRFVIRVRAIGYRPATSTLERRPETDRIRGDFALRQSPVLLDSILVVASSRDSSADGAGVGRSISQDRVNHLPLDAAGDLGALAGLAPGVVGIAGTDTTAAQFSVGGQRPSQNHISLDGLTLANATVPRDAIRSTRVVTSTYDVAKGQFSGGEVASTTRSGTDSWRSSLTYDRQGPELQAGAAPSPAFSREYLLNRFSGSAGGPLVAKRLFGFLAVEGSRKENPLATLLATDPLTDQRLGVSPDTVQRLLALATAAGLPLNPAGIPNQQTLNRGSALARFDYTANEANHVVLRANWNGGLDRGTRANPRALLQYLGQGNTSNGGVFLGLTTQSGALTNDVRATAQVDDRHETGYVQIPRGRVFIASTTADGSVSTLDASIGGNQDYPRTNHSTLFEAGDELAWITPGGAHRIKVGMLVNHGFAQSDLLEEKTGVYYYNSLAELAANTPSLYTRILGASAANTSRSGAALYAGDAWQPRPGLEIDFGLRAEGSAYGAAPVANPAVAAEFGLSTGQFPSELHLSPRFGFTYSSSGDKAGNSGLMLRGGFGEFRGTIPAEFFSQAAQATGLPSGQARLTCAGSDVPLPDWRAFLANPATVPTTCAGGNTITSAGQPNVVAFNPGAGAPRVWRASVGATRHLFGALTGAIDLFEIHGTSQLGLPDRNLKTSTPFFLANEGNRPIYAPASAINPATGTVSLNDSRLDPAYASVSEMISSLHSRTHQLTLSLTGETRSGLSLEASYTYSDVRDEALGFDGESADGSTAGNPNIAVWGRADEERRHQFEATVTIPVRHGIELSAVARLLSGFPYSPVVAQDINGDGQRNDRAFIFDPATTADTAIANGMRQLLANGPGTARSCLTSQLGQVAARNGCSGPWVPGLDLKLTVTPPGAIGERMTLALTALNTLVGVDELLHGTAGLRGWGQDAATDRRLLYVTGFEPGTQSFHYRVNQHYGSSSGALNPFRIPFVLSLQARVALGPSGK